MALNPGNIQGEEVQVGSKTYIWDGIKWNLKAVETVVDTLHVQLANPITSRSGRLSLDSNGYPLPNGLTTQSGANEYLHIATDWLKDNGGGGGGTPYIISETEPNQREDGSALENGDSWFQPSTKFLRIYHNSGWNHVDAPAEVIVGPDLPDPLTTDEGTLWVDEDTYDLFVLSGGQWIDLTALPDMSDYVKDADLQFTLNEYLRKRDAFDTYYPLSSMIHFIQPNGTFKVHLGDGPELDNIITRLIDAERDIIHIQDQIDNLGGDGETPPDTNHPGGQYEYGGGLSGTVPAGFWMASYNVTQWSQIFTFYVSETDLEGDNIDWADHVGEFIQVHRYSGDPHTGADFSSSAVYRINSVNDLGDYDTINVNLQYGTDKGTITIGETFTFEIIDEGTL